MTTRVKPPRQTKTKSDTFQFHIPGPNEYNKPPTDFRDYFCCIYGTKGIGKSTLFSSFPGNLTLMSEPLRRGLPIRMQQLKTYTASQIMDGAPDMWEILKENTSTIINDDSIQFITFDTIDGVYEQCMHSVSARNQVTNPGKAGKESSTVWIELREEFKAYFDTLRETGKGLGFVSHSKEREIDAIDTTAVSMVGPSAPPACLKYIQQACDFAMFYGYYLGKRCMVIRDPFANIWTGCGVADRFLQPDGKPILRLEMPDDPSQGYSRLVEAFNNKCWDMDTPEDERGSESKPKPKLKRG